ncbi:MAG: hypothetical protein ABII13_05390 [Patescibacteria group bacterium]|nr:hypothetical protein [Patescibacteria group bacterium]MBU2508802.1 hypothetical protein [Patescibacteria group bacterium]
MPEKRGSKNIKYGEITKTVLKLIAVLGVCSVFILMPGLAKAVPVYRKRPVSRNKKNLNLVLKRLQKRGLIKVWIDGNGKEMIKVTPKGQEEIVRYELRETKINKPRRWDRKWRVIIFDIPVDFNKTRDSLRAFLKKNDLVKLQSSVWIYPYPCEEAVELIRSALGTRDETLYLTCGRFTGDKWLCKHFKLK